MYHHDGKWYALKDVCPHAGVSPVKEVVVPQPEGTPVVATAENNWRFEFTPHQWLTGLKGSLATARSSNDFDASFDDLKDDVTGAFSGLFQKQYKRLVLVD